MSLRPSRLIPALAMAIALLLPGLRFEAYAAPSPVDKVDPTLRQQMSAYPDKKLPVIVEMYPPAPSFAGNGNEAKAREALDLLGKLGKDGSGVGGLPIVNGAAGFANAKGIDSLSRNTRVAYVHEDSPVYPRRGDADLGGTVPAGQLSAPYPRVILADKVWLEAPTGKGVRVAVLDSGIYPHPDLTLPANRIVARANFAGPLEAADQFDPGGHGTHVAGIIAGNGTHSDLSRRQDQPTLSGSAELVEYVGVAPAAELVDVRVLNRQGYGRVSSVIRGIEWVLENASPAKLNIRVVNLSVGAPARYSYRVDPLSAAVEIAWKRGLVVVAAAGNGGRLGQSVERPGVDPFVITVGALDDLTTLPATDDVVAFFSAWGVQHDPTPKPDIAAPGRKIASLRVPGSYLDRAFPDRVVTAKNGALYFRLTGTSMATAMVSGTVALMLERTPGLTPDQVKATLMGTTQVYGQDSKALPADPMADGSGLLDAHAAVSSPPRAPANQGVRLADTTARALFSALYGSTAYWESPAGSLVDWTNLAWDNLAWDNLAWDNLAWDNLAWDNLAWDNLAWDNLAWDNLAWDTAAWDALTLD